MFCLTNNLVFRQGKCGPSSLAESLVSRQTRYQGCCCPFLEVQFLELAVFRDLLCPLHGAAGMAAGQDKAMAESLVTEQALLIVVVSSLALLVQDTPELRPCGCAGGLGPSWSLSPGSSASCPADTAPGRDLQGELRLHLLPSIEGIIMAQQRKLPQALSGFSGEINSTVWVPYILPWLGVPLHS